MRSDKKYSIYSMYRTSKSFGSFFLPWVHIFDIHIARAHAKSHKPSFARGMGHKSKPFFFLDFSIPSTSILPLLSATPSLATHPFFSLFPIPSTAGWFKLNAPNCVNRECRKAIATRTPYIFCVVS